MNEIKFKHVFTSESGRVRVYEASQAMNKKADGELYEGRGAVKLYANKEKTEIKEVDFGNEFSFIAVSDAHTHYERLCFPAWPYATVSGNDSWVWVSDTIAGVNTFMTHGGDARSVKADQVYLRMLAKGNGYRFKRNLVKEG